MQKTRSQTVRVAGSDTSFDLKKTLIDPSSLDQFFTNYPHIYFRPKNTNLEIYASGVVYKSDTFIKFDKNIHLPCFIFGPRSKQESWGSLGKTFHILPQKWVIKRGKRAILFQFNHESISLDLDDQPCLNKEVTQDEAMDTIDKIRAICKNGQLQKYVYAIYQKKQIKAPFEFSKLQSTPANGTKFYLSLKPHLMFFGITPEWLYKRFLLNLTVDAIAGTTLISNLSYLEDPKIIDEFNYVKTDIMESLKDHVTSGRFQKTDSVITNHHLAHRANIFEGVIKPNVTDEMLIDILHPTSAISGYPKDLAKDHFKTFESFERGLFASAIGFYFQHQANIAVAIRSCFISGNNAYLFAGAGITKDSQPHLEWQELNNKLNVISSLLEF